MPGQDAVLFDLDGVLVDSRAAFAHSVNAALREHGMPERAETELHVFLGPPIHETFSALVDDPALIQLCVDSYRAHYRATAASETTVFPGIRELLEALAPRRPLVVATSKPRALAEPLLEALDLRRFFLAVVGPELSAENESKTETLTRALRELPPATRPTMVGDRRYDIAAAHAHELPAIGVLWGIGTEQELRSAGADRLVGTPAELARLLA